MKIGLQVHKALLLTGIALSTTSAAEPLTFEVAHTNLSDGDKYTIGQDITIDYTGTNQYAIAIQFGSDEISTAKGTLDGSGAIELKNTASAERRGTQYLVAVNAAIVTNLQSRSVIVINDLRDYTGGSANVASTAYSAKHVGEIGDALVVNSYGGQATNGSCGAAAYGILYGDQIGDISGTVSLRAKGGNSFSNGNARTLAYGIYSGDVIGNISGTVSAKATGGSASSDDRVYASTDAVGIGGDIFGNISGNVSSVAASGIAYSSKDAFTDTYAIGVGGNSYDAGALNGDLTGTISTDASGGSATSDSDAYARADAYAVLGDMNGNLIGSVSVTANGGFTDGGSIAESSADAEGVFGEVTGSLSGTVFSEAIGGTAYAVTKSEANADAYGILYGSVGGDLSGLVSAYAMGGISTSDNDADADARAYGIFSGGVDQELTGTVSADAIGGTVYAVESASASASAHGVHRGVEDGVLGNISANATGGSAVSGGNATAHAEAYGLSGNSTGSLNCDILGFISAHSTGGTANSDSTAYAHANAYGIYEDDVSTDISGTISATATGGTATGDSAYATAYAYGIQGSSITISNFTGKITASAIPGEETTSSTNRSAGGIAVGIDADDALYLNASAGSITAQVFGEGITNQSVAIQGGRDDDTLTLSNMRIVGDINLNGGENSLSILGDTSLEGNILAEDGQLNLSIISGELSLKGDYSRIEFSGAMEISSQGGIGLILSSTETNNPAVEVNGNVTIKEGATIAARPATGENGAGILGETFMAVSADNNLTEQAAFELSEDSFFIMEISNAVNSIYVTPTALKTQDSPTPSAILTTVSSMQTILKNLSAQTDKQRIISANTAATPPGTSGPSNDSEWKLYLRQFNDIGQLDSDSTLSGYQWTTHGFTIGSERKGGNTSIVGLSASGSWSDLEAELSNGRGDAEMITASAYGSWFGENWYSEIGTSAAYSWNKTDRIDLLNNSYSGDYNSILFGTWIEGGRNIPTGNNFSIEPYARMTYIHGEHDGYTESGSTTAPMTLEECSSDNLPTELGIRARKMWELNKESLIYISLSAGWNREWLDNSISVSTSVLGINQTITSPEADADSFALSFEGNWVISSIWTLALNYSPTFSDNWYNHNISSALHCRF